MEKNNNNESNKKEYNNKKRISGIKKGIKNLTPIDNLIILIMVDNYIN